MRLNHSRKSDLCNWIEMASAQKHIPKVRNSQTERQLELGTNLY
jgi:hypothetical protein